MHQKGGGRKKNVVSIFPLMFATLQFAQAKVAVNVFKLKLDSLSTLFQSGDHDIVYLYLVIVLM